MLLYTVVPYESIFQQTGDAPEMRTETRPIKGGFVELMRDGGGEYTVSRIISTDPRMYLGGLSPGDKYPAGPVDTN